jgi:hypothetical protein
MKNTLVYYDPELITVVKSFIVSALGVVFIKLRMINSRSFLMWVILNHTKLTLKVANILVIRYTHTRTLSLSLYLSLSLSLSHTHTHIHTHTHSHSRT